VGPLAGLTQSAAFTQTRRRACAARLGNDDAHYPFVDTESLFLRTLDDLEKRTIATDEYEVLLAAALLRKLVLDSPPLMDQVNATRRLKLSFRINGPTAYEEMIVSDGAVYFSVEDAIDPELDHRLDSWHQSMRRATNFSPDA
jgi:hypothetical protein